MIHVVVGVYVGHQPWQRNRLLHENPLSQTQYFEHCIMHAWKETREKWKVERI
jgi:xanthosine utilization system XapX-like protein